MASYGASSRTPSCSFHEPSRTLCTSRGFVRNPREPSGARVLTAKPRRARSDGGMAGWIPRNALDAFSPAGIRKGSSRERLARWVPRAPRSTVLRARVMSSQSYGIIVLFVPRCVPQARCFRHASWGASTSGVRPPTPPGNSARSGGLREPHPARGRRPAKRIAISRIRSFRAGSGMTHELGPFRNALVPFVCASSAFTNERKPFRPAPPRGSAMSSRPSSTRRRGDGLPGDPLSKKSSPLRARSLESCRLCAPGGCNRSSASRS